MPKRPIFVLQELDYKFGLQIVSGEITWENIVEDNTFATLHNAHKFAFNLHAGTSFSIWHILLETFLKYAELKSVNSSEASTSNSLLSPFPPQIENK